MIFVAIGAMITGAMLLSAGAALALQSLENKPAGVVMGFCGALLVLGAALALFLFLGMLPLR